MPLKVSSATNAYNSFGLVVVCKQNKRSPLLLFAKINGIKRNVDNCFIHAKIIYKRRTFEEIRNACN